MSEIEANRTDGGHAASAGGRVTASLWSFYDAPQEYRDLSAHGGDEDYVLFVPYGFQGYIDNIVRAIGVCDTSEHPVVGGTVYIGAHA